MTVDTSHGYANEAERGSQDIYDDFKLEKTFGLHGSYRNILNVCN